LLLSWVVVFGNAFHREDDMNERSGTPWGTITATILTAVLTLPGCVGEGHVGGGQSLEGVDAGASGTPTDNPGFVDAGDLEAPAPCVGVTCSWHGTCQHDDDTTWCECDDGYEAAGLACIPSEPATNGCLAPGSGDYAEPGPYEVEVMMGPPGFTVYYPATWEPGCLHPFGAWGNGTGVVGSLVYAHLNSHLASWGIPIIASWGPMAGSGLDHRTGIDWMLEQNENPDSPFFGHLSQNAGVAGHSQGGIGASMAASHENVVAEVNVQGGGCSFGRATLLITGTLDFMNPSIQLSWFLSTGPTVLASLAGADHIVVPSILGVGTDAGVQVKRLYAAWYRCFLADDANACALFTGGDACGICDDPNYFNVRSKNL